MKNQCMLCYFSFHCNYCIFLCMHNIFSMCIWGDLVETCMILFSPSTKWVPTHEDQFSGWWERTQLHRHLSEPPIILMNFCSKSLLSKR